MTLEAYRAKRRFDRTAEPSGEVAPRAVGAPRPESVLTGRTLAEVAAAGVGRTAEEAPLGAVAAIPGAEEAALPEVIAPTLATLAAAPPTRGEWVAEVKLDGYRLLAREEGAQVRLLMRSGRDWTGRFPAVAAAVRGLPADEAVLDGEIVVLDARGRPDFGRSRRRSTGAAEGSSTPCSTCSSRGGRDLRPAPLRARKEALRFLLSGAGAPLRYGDHVSGQLAAAFYREVCALGLEGAVYKRADGPYRGGRTREWLKVRRRPREELVVIGFTAPSGGGGGAAGAGGDVGRAGGRGGGGVRRVDQGGGAAARGVRGAARGRGSGRGRARAGRGGGGSPGGRGGGDGERDG